MEPNPSKDVHEGDDLSVIWSESIQFISYPYFHSSTDVLSYRAIETSGAYSPPAWASTQGLKCKTYMVTILMHQMHISTIYVPSVIRVRTDSPNPLLCRKRQLIGGGLSGETGKTEASCHSRCGTIKIPPCSKALSAEHRPKFCSSSPVMVTYPYKWNFLERT
jgi:hypothetical protein